jgi:hypothetical protein
MTQFFLCSPESNQDKVGRVIVDGVVDVNAWYKGRVTRHIERHQY